MMIETVTYERYRAALSCSARLCWLCTMQNCKKEEGRNLKCNGERQFISRPSAVDENNTSYQKREWLRSRRMQQKQTSFWLGLIFLYWDLLIFVSSLCLVQYTVTDKLFPDLSLVRTVCLSWNAQLKVGEFFV